MHAVVRRRVEHPFQRPQLADCLGVNPKLIQQVERRHGDIPGGRKADHGQRQIEHPGETTFEGALPQRHGEVVFLALMVHDVRRPGRGVFVGDAVEPVKAEVHAQHQHERGEPLGRRRRVGDVEHAKMFEQVQVAGKQQALEKDAHGLIDHTAAQIVDRIVEAIEPLVLHQPGDKLDADQQEEKRHRQRDVRNVGAEEFVDQMWTCRPPSQEPWERRLSQFSRRTRRTSTACRRNAHVLNPANCYGAATTGLVSVPTPSISTSTLSPGLMALVLPEVPVKIKSPGCSVTCWLMKLTSLGTLWMSWLVFSFCSVLPLSRNCTSKLS